MDGLCCASGDFAPLFAPLFSALVSNSTVLVEEEDTTNIGGDEDNLPVIAAAVGGVILLAFIGSGVAYTYSRHKSAKQKQIDARSREVAARGVLSPTTAAPLPAV